jgi:porphobilinogen deaminase
VAKLSKFLQSMLKIGKIAAQSAASLTLNVLKSHLIEAEIVLFKTDADAYIALQSADIQMIAKTMNHLESSLPTGIVISALSARQNAGATLYIHPNAVGTGGGLSLKTGVKIRVNTLLEQVQLSAFDPDWKIVLSGDADAFLATDDAANDLKFNGFDTFYLNPKELIPLAGQGVIAYLTRKDDLPTRKILQQMHHPNVSACTNIERTVKNLFLKHGFTGTIGAYCERDAQDNFHLWVCDATGKTVRVSQNTHFGLAETAFNHFLKHIGT